MQQQKVVGISKHEHKKTDQTEKSVMMKSAMQLSNEEVVDAPYFVVGAAVVGVWGTFFWKRIQMERLLGMHRAKFA